jgi:phosphohistidine phosphatase
VQTTSPDPAGTRTLVLMRHAKAEQYAEDDHARELTERGVREATEAGTWLAAQSLVPDVALVSSSARTVGTWEAVAAAAAYDLEPRTDDAWYAAGPDSALDLLREVGDDARTVLVIGHNPTIAFLAQTLDSGDGDPEASAGMHAGYPPAALTVLEVDGSWADLDLGGARVVAFRSGR